MNQVETAERRLYFSRCMSEWLGPTQAMWAAMCSIQVLLGASVRSVVGGRLPKTSLPSEKETQSAKAVQVCRPLPCSAGAPHVGENASSPVAWPFGILLWEFRKLVRGSFPGHGRPGLCERYKCTNAGPCHSLKALTRRLSCPPGEEGPRYSLSWTFVSD